jgi:hypothetical protein
MTDEIGRAQNDAPQPADIEDSMMAAPSADALGGG